MIIINIISAFEVRGKAEELRLHQPPEHKSAPTWGEALTAGDVWQGTSQREGINSRPT